MPLQTLTLMRHAKSDWKNAQLTDHDRTLNARGHRDAPDMATRLMNLDSVPELILCSTALRARETATHVLDVFEKRNVCIAYHQDLYLAPPSTMLQLLEREACEAKHVMLIAHNPGLEDLSAILSGLESDLMKTAAIRQFTCPCIADLCGAVQDSHHFNAQDFGVYLTLSDDPKNHPAGANA